MRKNWDSGIKIQRQWNKFGKVYIIEKIESETKYTGKKCSDKWKKISSEKRKIMKKILTVKKI